MPNVTSMSCLNPWVNGPISTKPPQFLRNRCSQGWANPFAMLLRAFDAMKFLTPISLVEQAMSGAMAEELLLSAKLLQVPLRV